MASILSAADLFIARRMFQLEAHKRDGQAFEDLFSLIMRLNNNEFVQVKPQGSYGDRKNDGFIKSSGRYFQVFAPEDATTKEKKTINKLVTDFAGLHSYWDSQVAPIKEFNFVLNDKYKGAYPSLHEELAKIEKANEGITCKPFLCQHLEEVFLGLSRQHMEDVLGQIPLPENISLEINILNEVVNHLIHSSNIDGKDGFPANPDFEQKIIFNELSPHVATFLRYASYQDGALKDYFKINSAFAKEELKKTFNQLYLNAVEKIPSSEQKADLVFFQIAENAFPSKEKIYRDAIFVLMAYFFSYCDIFEEPPIQEQPTLFG